MKLFEPGKRHQRKNRHLKTAIKQSTVMGTVSLRLVPKRSFTSYTTGMLKGSIDWPSREFDIEKRHQKNYQIRSQFKAYEICAKFRPEKRPHRAVSRRDHRPRRRPWRPTRSTWPAGSTIWRRSRRGRGSRRKLSSPQTIGNKLTKNPKSTGDSKSFTVLQH